MITLRQMRSVVAVAEEGSFTLAAQREHATQSGISQHVSAVEGALGVQLFDRRPEGAVPTAAGERYYRRAIEVLRGVEAAADEAKAAHGGLTGSVRAGLMPAFTRAALVPALERITARHPEIEVQVIEGYSGMLTDMVKAEELDFALVPATSGGVGLSTTHLARDREMLVGGPLSGLPHGEPVRLADLPPLKLVAPSRSNIRRARLEDYFETHGARIDRILEMDAMMGTLGLVARSDWVTVLPWLICQPDAEGTVRRLCPIDRPPLYLDFVVIEPARHPLPRQAKVFLDELRTAIQALVTT